MNELQGYESCIVLDSLGVRYEQRITTFESKIPKWLVAEFNTHRMLSRNSASSRAIPTAQIIDRVMRDPCIPVDFRSKNTGMVADVVLSHHEYEKAVFLWLKARDQMVKVVEQMMAIDGGIDKQRVNRLLEPWMWTIVISTATEWENFFYLRNSKEAQPEFGLVASNMNRLYAMKADLTYRKWHQPYIPEYEYFPDEALQAKVSGMDRTQSSMMLISAARCGRVSYYRHGMTMTPENDLARGLGFMSQKHWSPLEHPCTEVAWKWYGNLFSWKPLRKFFSDESGASPKRRMVEGVLHALSTERT